MGGRSEFRRQPADQPINESVKQQLIN